MATTVKKTYHKRTRTMAPLLSSSPEWPVPPPPPSTRASRKRARSENDDSENIHPTKRQNITVKALSTVTSNNKQTPPSKKPRRKPLTQLQLALSTQPALRSCDLCGLSYTRGTPEDESLHRSHCARVTKGMEWGRDEEKERSRVGVSVVQEDVKLRGGEHGRVISFRADVSGKIGAKVSAAKLLGAGYLTVTTCVVIYNSIYNQSCALSSKSYTRNAGRFEGLPVPCARQQERQTGTHCRVLDRSADQDRDGSGRKCHRGCAGRSLPRLPR